MYDHINRGYVYKYLSGRKIRKNKGKNENKMKRNNENEMRRYDLNRAVGKYQNRKIKRRMSGGL